MFVDEAAFMQLVEEVGKLSSRVSEQRERLDLAIFSLKESIADLKGKVEAHETSLNELKARTAANPAKDKGSEEKASEDTNNIEAVKVELENRITELETVVDGLTNMVADLTIDLTNLPNELVIDAMNVEVGMGGS